MLFASGNIELKEGEVRRLESLAKETHDEELVNILQCRGTPETVELNYNIAEFGE